MKYCKYCNSLMVGEYETKSNNSYFEFHVCHKCHAVYECTTVKKGRGREKYEVHENERWFNPKTGEWE